MSVCKLRAATLLTGGSGRKWVFHQDIHTFFIERFQNLRQVGEAIAMDDEAVEGVADADAARLGIHDDGNGLLEVSGTINVAMDDASARFDDWDASILADVVDEATAATGNDKVHHPTSLQQTVGVLMTGEKLSALERKTVAL